LVGTDITIVGTIATGTWNATAIAAAKVTPPGSTTDLLCNISSAFSACNTGVAKYSSSTIINPQWGDGTNFLLKWDGVNSSLALRNSGDSAYQKLEPGDLTVHGTASFNNNPGINVSAGATGVSWFNGSADTGLFRNAAGVLEVNNGTAGTFRDLKLEMLRVGQTTAPTCTSNCGTSPSITGSDTAMTITMGSTGSPASGFVVTFNHTWAAAPACTMQMDLASMVIGKLPIAIATTTTTVTVTTNGTAPSTSDKYNMHCIGIS
jgi:hypothetical protein